MVSAVRTHAHIWITIYYLCICKASMHANETCKMCGKTSLPVQAKMHGCIVRANKRYVHVRYSCKS